jgi:hypothetical protein
MSGIVDAAAAALLPNEMDRKSITHEILDTFRAALETCVFTYDVDIIHVFRQTDALEIMDEGLDSGKELLSCDCPGTAATCHHPPRPDSLDQLIRLRSEWFEEVRHSITNMPGYLYDKRKGSAFLVPYLYNGDPTDTRVVRYDPASLDCRVIIQEQRPQDPAGGREGYQQRLEHLVVALNNSVPPPFIHEQEEQQQEEEDSVRDYVAAVTAACRVVPEEYFQQAEEEEEEEEENNEEEEEEEDEEEEEEEEEEEVSQEEVQNFVDGMHRLLTALVDIQKAASDAAEKKE